MNKLIISAVALACTLPAFAGNKACDTKGNSNGNTTNQANANQSQSQSQNATGGSASSVANGGSVGSLASESTSRVGNTTASGGSGGQGGAGGTGGNGGTGGTSTSESGSSSQSGASSNGQAITDNYAAAHIPVNTALAGFQTTTAGCRYGEGLGVQLSNAGVSGGLSFKDHDCARLQLAEFFYSRGQDIAGDRVICQIREVQQALGDDCLGLVHEVTATVPSDAVTHAELRTVERSINQQKGNGK